MKFGERLKELRRAAGITQAELAEKLNLHLQTISKWERGLYEPDIAQLGELAVALGITLEKLCGQEECPETFTGDFQPEKLGLILAEQRMLRGESQEQLAASVEISPDTISRWERGVTCPDIEKLLTLAVHFEVPISKLYCGISQTAATENVTSIRKRKHISVAGIAAVAAIICLVSVLLIALLPGKQPAAFTVTLDGREIRVSATGLRRKSRSVWVMTSSAGWTRREMRSFFPK